GLKKPGVCQTAPCRSPYFYEEDNWVDDMELAAASLGNIHDNGKKNWRALNYPAVPGIKHYPEYALLMARKEKQTPWIGADTAKHYQWYPFINIGHYELAKQLKGKERQELISYYKQGIEKLWNKARQNAFLRGVPFICCSNNLTTCFAIQCYWY